MKLHSLLAATLLAIFTVPSYAHPGGHDFDEENQPSQVECAQLKKLSKEEADKPAMKELKQQCAQAEIEKARKQ